MPNEPIGVSGARVDLSPRIAQTNTVSASPSGSSETIIATLTLPQNVNVVTGAILLGWAALTIGTSGTSANLRVRQTNVSGTVVANSGACTAAATNLIHINANGLDNAGVFPGQVYVLTLTIAAGAATSTVSACQLLALLV